MGLKQRGFFDVDERLKRGSDLDDPLAAMAAVIDFEGLVPGDSFRPPVKARALRDAVCLF